MSDGRFTDERWLNPNRKKQMTTYEEESQKLPSFRADDLFAGNRDPYDMLWIETEYPSGRRVRRVMRVSGQEEAENLIRIWSIFSRKKWIFQLIEVRERYWTR